MRSVFSKIVISLAEYFYSGGDGTALARWATALAR